MTSSRAGGRGPVARIDDHRAIETALDVEVRDRTGGAVIHEGARGVDGLLNDHGFVRIHRSEVHNVGSKRVGVQSMGGARVVGHGDLHLVALAGLQNRGRQLAVVGPGVEAQSHAEFDRGLAGLEHEGLFARSGAGCGPPREERKVRTLERAGRGRLGLAR